MTTAESTHATNLVSAEKASVAASLLLIGPLPISGDHVGGTKVSFRQMVDDLTNTKWLNVEIINLSRPLKFRGSVRRSIENFLASMRILFTIMINGGKHDVWALNISPSGAFALGPTIYLLSKIKNKPLVVRLFGGALDADLSSTSFLRQWFFRNTTAKCKILLLQTQALVAEFESLGNIKWFPTTRNVQVQHIQRERCRNIVFLSQIRKEKGVRVAIDAAKQLTDICTIDFYGSPVDASLVDEISETACVSYCGEIEPEKVPMILGHYDALILPTHWPSEGLPGVIIEAFQCGVPVISTRWMQIPEIVADGMNGLLIEPHSTDALVNAIRDICEHDELYQHLCTGAVLTGKKFNSVEWNLRFANWCLEAADGTTIKN